MYLRASGTLNIYYEIATPEELKNVNHRTYNLIGSHKVKSDESMRCLAWSIEGWINCRVSQCNNH
jgi:hypothetical protein